MLSLFGALLVISFIEFGFIKRHFKFLKTIAGKGFFNLFLASMFLVGDDGLWGMIMTGSLAVCGLFFILVGCACINGYEDKDLTKNDIRAGSLNSESRGSLLNTA